jgi:hypothetical protein
MNNRLPRDITATDADNEKVAAAPKRASSRGALSRTA